MKEESMIATEITVIMTTITDMTNSKDTREEDLEATKLTKMEMDVTDKETITK